MLSGLYTLVNRLSLDGEFVPEISHNINDVKIVETVDGLYACEIDLLNHGPDGFLYFERDAFDFGTRLEFAVVLGTETAKLFQGYIYGLEARYLDGGGSRLCILAEDDLQNLRMTRRSRTFEEMSDEDVMQAIAQEHSLVTEFVDLTGPTHPVLAQTNLSDLAFMRQCARRLNAELWIDNGRLHAAPRTARGSERLALAYGANLRDFEVRADLAHQCTELFVGGWDVEGKEAIHESAVASAVSSELNELRGGSAILEEAFGRRPASLVHTLPLSSEEARAVAKAEYQQRARRFVTGHGTADGDPRLRVGTTLSLTQLGPMFDGDYYVVATCHRVSLDHGYRTEFEVERAGVG